MALNKSNRLKNYDPDEFVDAYNTADSHEARAEVRERLKQLEGGRWYDLLEKSHNHIAHADLTARRGNVSVHSETFLQWVGVYGLVEDLNTFTEMTGIERER